MRTFWIVLWVFTFHLAAQAGFLSTDGARIVDKRGRAVRLYGVSWFGMETETGVVHGLWSRGYRSVLAQIRTLGFNLVRLPFSNTLLEPGAKPAPGTIDYAKNPDLKNRTSLEILDRIIEHAGSIGLDVMLDRHRPEGKEITPLWYTEKVPEARWISDWVTLARRYRKTSNVVAFDLHNEPHGEASWGTGHLPTDWRLAAERAAAAIQKENPEVLLVVEGIQSSSQGQYWWGGNLSAAGQAPVRAPVPNKVVYSAHDYPESVHPQPWFGLPGYPKNLVEVWEAYWGYLVTEKKAPVILGEFGTRLETQSDKLWLDSLLRYVKTKELSFVFWCLNPNSIDTGGLLKEDWLSVELEKLRFLKTAMP